MTGRGRARRIAWWLCRPSLGRALLCGAAAIYVGTFIAADALTMFCAAQGVRLLVRALARRSARTGMPLLTPRWRDRSTVEPAADPGFAIGEPYPGASHAPTPVRDPEPELTLDELIAGDPGPEPADPGPEFGEPAYAPSPASVGGDEGMRIAPGGDADVPAASPAARMPVGGSDAAEALRIAVAEIR